MANSQNCFWYIFGIRCKRFGGMCWLYDGIIMKERVEELANQHFRDSKVILLQNDEFSIKPCSRKREQVVCLYPAEHNLNDSN